jgi:NAD(P)-dependent dehydrogenase (short-subunit alcohol dehydrogenase family)
MESLAPAYRALVLGASGAIGAAFVQALQADPRCAQVQGLSRQSQPLLQLPAFQLDDEASIAQAAQSLKAQGGGPYHLIIDATGALVIDGQLPEKRLGELKASTMLRAMQINAIGPALLIKHFAPLLPQGKSGGRCIYAKLSARVGSIGDNRKGGWYSYRAAKAALNMLLQTAALELQRQNPACLVAALQPGTVQSKLSSPFVADPTHALSPATAVQGMLTALDQLSEQSGAQFVDWRGERIVW